MARTRRSRSPLKPAVDLAHSTKVVTEIHAQAAEHDSRISQEEIQWTLSFLKYFGYLPGKKLDEVAFDDFCRAVAGYQKFAGLHSSGVLDQRTANAMQAPRCGMSDVGALRQQLNLGENEPLPVSEPKWNKPAINYYIEAYVNGIPHSVQEDIIATAYGHWTAVCGLKIGCTRDRSKADIVIGTGQGPRNQFDGPGNTLAWAYLPPGDDRQLLLLYDLDESWAASVTGTPREILMENVTCHEGGHTLGLEHSKVQSALMAPYYAANVNKPVSPDDIERIQRRYGPPQAAPATPVTPTVPAGAPGQVTIQVSGSVSGITIPGYRVTKMATIEEPTTAKKAKRKRAGRRK